MRLRSLTRTLSRRLITTAPGYFAEARTHGKIIWGIVDRITPQGFMFSGITRSTQNKMLTFSSPMDPSLKKASDVIRLSGAFRRNIEKANLYERFKNQDHFTLEEACAAVFESKDVSLVQRYATHSSICYNYKKFDAELKDDALVYMCRSDPEIEEADALEEAIRRNSCDFVNFMGKCRKSIKGEAVMFDKDDRFLRALIMFIGAGQGYLNSPYHLAVTAILRALNHRDDTRGARMLLKNIKVLSPWDGYNVQKLNGSSNVFRELEKSVEFNRLEKLAANNIAQAEVQDEMLPLRRDFGYMNVYTIDDAGTFDVDDGLSIEHVKDGGCPWIHIHVADPSILIKPGSVLFDVAQHRASSCYLPTHTVRMLHDSFTARFSLEPGRENFAVTFSARLDEQGKIHDYKIQPSIVRNIRKISYNQLDSVFEPESKFRIEQKNPVFDFARKPLVKQHLPEEELNDLRLMDELLYKRFNYRHNRGGFSVNLPQISLKVTNFQSLSHLPHEVKQLTKDQKPNISVSYDISIESPASMIVSESMVLAGRIAALYAQERNIPFIYRKQECLERPDYEYKPGERHLPFKESIFFLDKLRGSVISTEAGPHDALGIKAYSQTTSPIRRVVDLINHIQIKSSILPQYKGLTTNDINANLPRILKQIKLVTAADRSDRVHWARMWLKQNPDLVLNGMIFRPLHNGDGHMVYLKEICYGVAILSRNTFSSPELGKWICVKAREDPMTSQLMFYEVNC